MSLQFANLWHYKANAKDPLRCLVAWWTRYHRSEICWSTRKMPVWHPKIIADIATLPIDTTPPKSRWCCTVERALYAENRKVYWPIHTCACATAPSGSCSEEINLCSVSEHPPWLWTAQLNPILGRPLLDPAQGVEVVAFALAQPTGPGEGSGVLIQIQDSKQGRDYCLSKHMWFITAKLFAGLDAIVNLLMRMILVDVRCGVTVHR